MLQLVCSSRFKLKAAAGTTWASCPPSTGGCVPPDRDSRSSPATPQLLAARSRFTDRGFRSPSLQGWWFPWHRSRFTTGRAPRALCSTAGEAAPYDHLVLICCCKLPRAFQQPEVFSLCVELPPGSFTLGRHWPLRWASSAKAIPLRGEKKFALTSRQR